MFKNLIFYRTPKGWTPDAEQLARGMFKPCGEFEVVSRGWAEVRGEPSTNIHGQHYMVFVNEQRLLPASVIRRAVDERAKQIEEQQGYAPGRKQLRELKERVTEELIPKAFPIENKTQIWIDPEAGILGINTASPSKAESVIEHMRQSLDTFPLAPFATSLSPASAMADWLAGGEAPPDFTIDKDCELKGFEHNAVKYINESLEGDEVRTHLSAGKLPTKLGMTYNERISFMLTATGALNRIHFLDITKDSAQEAETLEEQFDIDFTIMAGEFRNLIQALAYALGGYPEE